MGEIQKQRVGRPTKYKLEFIEWAEQLCRDEGYTDEQLAVENFLYELRDSLRFYDLPGRWWKRLRTNDPLERLIKTLRSRLNPMGCFHDEPAVERAVFGQLLRWHKIKLTHNT